MVGGLLREGNSGNAAQADQWIPGLVQRIRQTTGAQAQVRFDSGFTGGHTLSALDAANVPFVGRITSNAVLDRMTQPYLKRPAGRPSEQLLEWCHEFYYKAESWDQYRRIVLVLSERPDDLFLHHFFLLTSLDSKDWHGHEVLSLYRRRGKAEGHMGELKDTLSALVVDLLLDLYAYQLIHSLRALLEQVTLQGWSLRKLREQILKVAATVAVHARGVKVHIGRTGNKWWPVLSPAQASILAASIVDISIAFCRTHDGISHALRDALVSVPEKATNALKLG